MSGDHDENMCEDCGEPIDMLEEAKVRFGKFSMDLLAVVEKFTEARDKNDMDSMREVFYSELDFEAMSLVTAISDLRKEIAMEFLDIEEDVTHGE